VVPPMAAKKWATGLYYSGVVLVFLGVPFTVLGTHRSSVLASSVGVVLYISAALAGIVGIAISRCPHCGRRIDLRGPSAHCPKCGKWIPFDTFGSPKEQQPPSLL
jgi:tRNA(Ile2) C34 agmatinyltransferase TiaS